jgi:hypothetical protein
MYSIAKHIYQDDDNKVTELWPINIIKQSGYSYGYIFCKLLNVISVLGDIIPFE